MLAGDGGARQVDSVRVRPKPSLIRSGLLVLLIVPLPLFAVLVFEGGANGSWPVGIAGELTAVLVCVLAYIRFQGTSVTVTSTAIIERGFFGHRTTSELSDVANLVMVHTYSNSTADTLPQLIARDRDGGRLLRLRGVFWTEEAMRAVATASGVELEVLVEPLTAAQFFARFPGSAYWFENRRGLAIAATVVGGLACIGLVLGLMHLLNLPISR